MWQHKVHQNVLSAHVEDNGAGWILPKVGDLKVSLSPLGGKGHRALDCCVVQALVKPMLCLGKVDKLFWCERRRITTEPPNQANGGTIPQQVKVKAGQTARRCLVRREGFLTPIECAAW